MGFAGASGASDPPDDAFLYHGFDDSSVKGEKGESVLGKAHSSRAFHEVVTLKRVSSLMRSRRLPLHPRSRFLGWISVVLHRVVILGSCFPSSTSCLLC